MGFIEDERRKQAAKGDAGQRSRALSEQQSREKRQREVAEKAAREAQAAKSQQQLEQSGLEKMIYESEELGMHEGSAWTDGHYSSDGSVHIKVSKKGDKQKTVSIETTPDGTITIQGGLLGSTTLSKDQWSGKNGQEALENALGKALKHPRSVKDKPFTYSPIEHPYDDLPRGGM